MNYPEDVPHADATALLTTLWQNALNEKISALAEKKGVLAEAMEDVMERARGLFVFSANGDLRGKDGITPHGWLAFVLPRDAPHLYAINADADPTPSQPQPAAPRASARERLDQANGAPGVRF